MLSPGPLELGGERETARTATRARRGDEHALLLLFVEVGAIQHGAHLLLKQIMQRCGPVGERIDFVRYRRRAGFPRPGRFLRGSAALSQSSASPRLSSCRNYRAGST